MQELHRLLNGRWAHVRAAVVRLMTDEPQTFKPTPEVLGNAAAYREWTWRAAKRLMSARLVPLSAVVEEPGAFLAWFYAVSLFDHSLAIKMAVQYSLFGQTVARLGTAEHTRLSLPVVA